MTLSKTWSRRCRRATTEQPNLKDEGSVTATRMLSERFKEGIEGGGAAGSFIEVVCSYALSHDVITRAYLRGIPECHAHLGI